jgi:hypothetical protein
MWNSAAHATAAVGGEVLGGGHDRGVHVASLLPQELGRCWRVHHIEHMEGRGTPRGTPRGAGRAGAGAGAQKPQTQRLHVHVHAEVRGGHFVTGGPRRV